MQQTARHVVSQDMVPTFIVPLKPETRVPEKSITRYSVTVGVVCVCVCVCVPFCVY